MKHSRIPILKLQFLVVLSFFEKNIPNVVVRDVCPSVTPSVCLFVRQLSEEIISFRRNLLSNRSIDLKFGLNVR